MTDPTASKTKWTPGPWGWDCGDCGIDYSHRYCTITADGGNLTIAEINDKFDEEEGHANAQLFLAAPALYEALSDLLRCYDERDDPSHIEWHAAAIALADARGES